MFLNVCKDLEIDVMLISIPVNGMWYDYTGFSKEDREGYYEKIRVISKDYNVRLADFSDKEYEKYFLRDIMHIGWKGWVYVDEAIYNFYQE
jgi:D-alanine transfer protein